MQSIVRISLLISAFLCAGCQEETDKRKAAAEKITKNELKEPLIKVNQKHVKIESEQIDAFVKRHEWNVKETKTGLRYLIYRNGEGPLAVKGQTATVAYKVKLLDGRLCYEATESEPHSFLIGMDHVESGLHEGITLLKVGDKAKLIIPSHLAHGLIGDQNKIPMRSTIIYDIELLALK